MKRIVLAALASLALAGCETFPSITGPAKVCGVMVSGPQQGLIVAHNAYQGAASVATLAVKGGAIKGDRLTQLEKVNDEAYARLVKARAGVDVLQNAAAACDALVQIYALARN